MNIHTITFPSFNSEEDVSDLLEIVVKNFSEEINHTIPDLKNTLLEESNELKKMLETEKKLKMTVENKKDEILKSEIFNHIILEINNQFKSKKLTKAYVLENVYDLVHNYSKIPSDKLHAYFKALKQNR